MIGRAGGKKDDVCITVDLSVKNGIEIDIISKMDKLYGDQMKHVIRETLSFLNITQVKVICEDFGGLDFVICARVKSAVRKVREVDNG